MLNYYFGKELYTATLAMLAVVAVNLVLLFFIPFARRTFGYVVLLFGVVLVLNMARYQYQLGLFGARAQGRVVELVAVTSDSTNLEDRTPDTITYRPVVSFAAADGEQVQFRAQQDVNEGVYSVGQTVPVRYTPAHPGFAEVDSWLSLWRPMLLGSLFDWAVCAAGLLLVLKVSRKRPLPRQTLNPALARSAEVRGAGENQ